MTKSNIKRNCINPSTNSGKQPSSVKPLCTITMGKLLLLNLLIALLIISCQNERKESNDQNLENVVSQIVNNISAPEFLNKDTLVFEKLADDSLRQDSSSTLYIGDCFVLDSFPEYGFICYEMLGKHTCAMAPVKLDSTQIGLESFKNGTIRMVGIEENKYVEGMYIWSKEEKEEFLLAFRKVGNLNLANKRPAVTSYGSMLKYNAEKFDHFITMQNSTYSEENKIYPKVSRLIDQDPE